MRKVILYMMMSYDGYLANENNGLDWSVADPSMEGDDLLTSGWDTAIIGYGGYKDLSAYWPTAKKDDPNISKNDAVFADKINSMKKFVFAGSKHELTWNNCELVLISDDASIIDALTRIKQQPGKDIVVYGGVRIAQTLARLDLFDDYLPVTQPVVIGNGKPLFENVKQSLKLELVNVKHNKAGAVRIHYRRVR
ncbi:MAG: dihydrofolate reductase family protein [Anaerolineae bacterium]|nr:dihydrofolate reductase family protein [Anaerolineae bacterium]